MYKHSLQTSLTTNTYLRTPKNPTIYTVSILIEERQILNEQPIEIDYVARANLK